MQHQHSHHDVSHPCSLYLKWPNVFFICLVCVRAKFAHSVWDDFFQVSGSETKPTDSGSGQTGGQEDSRAGEQKY